MTVTALHASAADLRAFGRERRREVPRREHAGWSRPDGAPDPLDLVEESEAGRVAELLPLRHARMSTTPLAFYRATAGLMAADLATTPSSGVVVQSCGDCHLSNFGVYASPERRLVFDLNDFDETYPAPFEWDVKRLAASLVLTGRAIADEVDENDVVRVAVGRYAEAMLRDAQRPTLDVWYQSLDADQVVDALRSKAAKDARKKADKGLRKARSKTSLGALSRFAEHTEDGWRIRHEPPVVVRYPNSEQVEGALRELFTQYGGTLAPHLQELFGRYRFADFARKVVGVGSVGTEAFMFLFIGPTGEDPLFLQLKEAGPSVLAPYVDDVSVPEHEGRRVVEGQRLMQASSDIFLGWASGGQDGSQAFYVRQLRDMKGSTEVETLSARELRVYAGLCGEALARAHARCGMAAAIAGYVGKGDAFDKAVASFARAYADQTEADHAAMVQAIADGRFETTELV